jgi:hypothetical protein
MRTPVNTKEQQDAAIQRRRERDRLRWRLMTAEQRRAKEKKRNHSTLLAKLARHRARIKADPIRSAASAEWHKKHYVSVKRDRYLRRSYGISEDEYNEIFSTQGGVCAICFCGPEKTPRRRLAVDHCHSTGTVRGLLCVKCNAMIGLAKDKENLLASAIAYLRRHDD